MTDWISVKERLPDSSSLWVLFYAKDSGMFGGVKYGWMRPDSYGVAFWHPPLGVPVYRADQVTHWMPLPDPPKEELQ